MRIALKHIAQAIDLDGDESAANVAVAIRNIETILDAVADGLENDREASALGDASNLLQRIREGLAG
jgi:hypothetical protein